MVNNMIEERGFSDPNGQRMEAAGWTPPPQDKVHSNAATPTDVRDVQFWANVRAVSELFLQNALITVQYENTLN